MNVSSVKKCDCCGKLYLPYKANIWSHEGTGGEIASPVLQLMNGETFSTLVELDICKRCYLHICQAMEERYRLEAGRND